MNENRPPISRREMYTLLAACPAAFGMMAAGVHARDASHSKSAGKVLMPIGDATESMDSLYAIFRLAEEGYEVVVSGPEARLYHSVMHEQPPYSDVPWDLTQETKGYHIEATVAFKDVRPEEYVGLFLSGGRAPEYIRYDKDLMRLTQHFIEQDKPIAVVCHGIEIIAAAGGLKGGRRRRQSASALWISLKPAVSTSMSLLSLTATSSALALGILMAHRFSSGSSRSCRAAKPS
ncbi:MAG: DJ-1/PfpI family protein [Pirellulaceae bacterium]